MERKRRVDEVKESIEAAKAAHLAWFHARIEDLGSMPCVMEVVEDAALSGYGGIGEKVSKFESATGTEVDGMFCPRLQPTAT